MWDHLSHARALKLEKLVSMYNVYIYTSFFFKFILNGQKNKGVECRYLSPYKSEVTGADVEWVVDEKYGWSACSETCAGGKLLLK